MAGLRPQRRIHENAEALQAHPTELGRERTRRETGLGSQSRGYPFYAAVWAASR